MNTSATRYLPTYEDVVTPYSLRLPAYRSTYIRRYHPYARYIAPLAQEECKDVVDEQILLLDLAILDRRLQTPGGRPNVQNGPLWPREAPQERIEQPMALIPADQANFFIRIDITKAIVALEKLRVD